VQKSRSLDPVAPAQGHHLLREPVVQVQGPWLEQVTTRYWNPGGRLSDLVSPQVRELVIVSTEELEAEFITE